MELNSDSTIQSAIDYRVEDIKEEWSDDIRWRGIIRDYKAEDVLALRGSYDISYYISEYTSERLWNDLVFDAPVRALGALTPCQAIQMVQAGLKGIYVSGWQVAADRNGDMYPDQSLYPCDKVPQLVRAINNALLRQDRIEVAENGDADIEWLTPIIADGEAGFGGKLNVFEVTKMMIEAGVAGVHFEDQLSSEKKCGHLGGKVLVPTCEFVDKLKAARLAADVCNVPIVIIARTDAYSARLMTSNHDIADDEFTVQNGSSERINGFWRIPGGVDMAIARGLSYAPYADVLWMETPNPSLEDARKFAEAIHEKFPGKLLAYNCFSRETEFITDGGTKSFVDFNDGDEIIVLTHKGNWKKATVRCYGKQALNSVTFAKGDGSKSHVVEVTPNHRWLLNNGSETTRLSVGDKLLSAPFVCEFNYDNLNPLEKLYWCYGYVYGDGTKTKSNGEYKYSMVRLCGKDFKFKERFEEIGFKTSSSASLAGDFIAYTGSYLKTLPDLQEDSVELIRAFVNGWLQADGAKISNSNGQRFKSIQATGEDSVRFLRAALPMCGFYITREEDYTRQQTNFGIRQKETIRFNISYCKPKYNKVWNVIDIKILDKKDVWCLEVEDDKSFVLPFGLSTGNCSPSFNWSKHLTPEECTAFQGNLAEMGYVFQFVTLAGFHSLNSGMFDLALDYERNGMLAYSELQDDEFQQVNQGYTAVKHQKFVGTSYFDLINQTISGENETAAMRGSTEEEQF